jgi:hypothetical protein
VLIYSLIRLTRTTQAAGPDLAPVIQCAHGFVAAVAWNAHVEVLHDVLLYEGLPSVLSETLLQGECVDVLGRKPL